MSSLHKPGVISSTAIDICRSLKSIGLLILSCRLLVKKIMIAWLKRCWRLLVCEHQYIFIAVIDDHHLRAGFNHRSKVYKCVRCGKCETREEYGSLEQ